jgi:UTP--glucose-1-phosphate uridylyltransferase
VQQTPSELLHLFGTVRGKLIQENPRVYDVDHIFEKPSVEYAEANLRVGGLLWGIYLCFFGMHIFLPSIFDSLQYAIDHDLREKGEFQLTSAQERLREGGERYLAFEAVGDRYDIGIPFGFAQTQAALAINSVFREQMLSALVGMLAVPSRTVPEAFQDR